MEAKSNQSAGLLRVILTEKFLFSILLILQTSFFVFNVCSARIPVGHDGFQYFSIQYYFLNNAVVNGEVAQWMPFMTQGSLAAWWYVIQASIPQQIFLLAAPLLKSFNFFPLFHLGMFADELIFMTGCWLLARRFFSSVLTVFFVVLTAVMSCVWWTQIWYAFHYFYCLPLILFFFHGFIDHGDRKKLFWGCNVLIVQMLGNLPYLFTVSTFVIFLYFLSYVLFNWKDVTERIRATKWDRGFLLGAAFLGLLLFLAFLLLTAGMGEMRYYTFGRSVADATTRIQTFLTYGKNQDLFKWSELLARFSPSIDFTLYSGMLFVPMLLLSLGGLNRRSLHWIVFLALLLDFSTGGVTAVVAYHAWPMMHYYRHVGLVSPMIKVFLCFVAGFGFERLLLGRVPRFSILLVLGIFAGSFVFINVYFSGPDIAQRISYSTALDHSMFLMKTPFSIESIAQNVERSRWWALAAVLLLVAAAFLKQRRWYGIIFLVGLQIADLYSFKLQETFIRTHAIPRYMDVTEFQPMPFAQRRSLDAVGHDRRSDFYFDLPIQPVHYNSSSSFLFCDEVGSTFRVNLWLKPLDRFMRTYWGQPLDDTSQSPKGWHPFWHLILKSDHPSFYKVTGVSKDKIQFFSSAERFKREDDIAQAMVSPAFSGDRLLVFDPGQGRVPGDPSGADRLEMDYKIVKFTANTLKIALASGAPSGTWLSYADVWHPSWKVRLNDKERPVWRANMAYKAVELEPGAREVEFRFGSALVTFIEYVFMLNAFFCMILVIAFAIKIWKSDARESIYD